MGKRIIRVFPRRTKATPEDDLAYIGVGPGLIAEADEVHISVAFTWDLPKAEKLARQWKQVAPVKIGGPATGERSEEFVPGMYVKHGYTITSRGCPNKCWFCSVWRREGVGVRELPICDGFDVLDDNLLACSDEHIKAVFSMLRRQDRPVKFTGGLEAVRLEDWHVEEMLRLKLNSVVFAYDTEDDLEPLQQAGRRLAEAGLITGNNVVFRCYVLVGFPKDSYGKAERRIHQTMRAGFVPYVMVYRGEGGSVFASWGRYKRRWLGMMNVLSSICQEARAKLISNTKGRS